MPASFPAVHGYRGIPLTPFLPARLQQHLRDAQRIQDRARKLYEDACQAAGQSPVRLNGPTVWRSGGDLADLVRQGREAVGRQGAGTDENGPEDALVGPAEIERDRIADAQHLGQKILFLVQGRDPACHGARPGIPDQGQNQVPQCAPRDPAIGIDADDDLATDAAHRVTPVDYGDVCLNYDKAAFAAAPPPQTLADLASPAYRGMLVVEDPATSSPGLAFLLATIAFGEILSRVVIALRPVTGGSTGLAGIPEPDLGLGFEMTAGRYYYLVFVILAICLYIIYRIVNSHYGYALRGIHDNERRMQALGYNTWLYKYTSWIIAGIFGGVAGVLFAYFGGIMAPNNLAMITSDIAFLLVIMGSTTVFFGPLVASVVYVGVEYVASLYLPDGYKMKKIRNVLEGQPVILVQEDKGFFKIVPGSYEIELTKQ